MFGRSAVVRAQSYFSSARRTPASTKGTKKGTEEATFAGTEILWVDLETERLLIYILCDLGIVERLVCVEHTVALASNEEENERVRSCYQLMHIAPTHATGTNECSGSSRR